MSIVPNSACGSEVPVLNLASPCSSDSPHLFAHTPSCNSGVPRPTAEENSDSHDRARPRATQRTDGEVSDNAVSPDERTGKIHDAPGSSEASPRRAAGDNGETVNGSKNGFSSQELASQPRKLHRIAEVRKSQGLSERSACKRLSIDIATLRELEDPANDLTLSELLKVQSVLEVPLVDLVEDSNSLARPIQERAKLVRIMKTVAAIEESVLANRPKRLVEMLREQLVDLMPELTNVGSWPQFGSRRGSASIARVLEREINLSQLSSE